MDEAKSKSDEYNGVVRQAALSQIRLTGSSFRVDPHFRERESESDKFIDQSVEEPHYDEATKLLLGGVVCRVWMNEPSDEEKKPAERDADAAFESAIFAVEAEYFVVFEVPDGHDKETLSVFFERMAPFSVWPYFRSHVAQVSAEADLEVPIIPIKKLFHPVKSAGGYTDPDEVEE